MVVALVVNDTGGQVQRVGSAIGQLQIRMLHRHRCVERAARRRCVARREGAGKALVLGIASVGNPSHYLGRRRNVVAAGQIQLMELVGGRRGHRIDR